MHRIDSNTAVAVMPAPAAAGAPGYFTRGNPGPGIPVPSTNYTPEWSNAVQEEIVGVIAAAGIALDKTNNGQMLAAIKNLLQNQGGNYAADTGAANAYVATFAPALTAHTVGLPIRIKIANTNTAASTFNPNGLGAKNIVTPYGNAVPKGMLKVGAIVTLVYDGTSYQISSLTEQGQSLSATVGYFILPGGIIVQFGHDVSTLLTSGVTFPVAFPTACITCVATKDAADNSGAGVNVSANATSATFYVTTTNAKYWVAVGY